MAKLVILYHHPKNPAAFEEYYANHHIPYAAEHMPGVTGAQNLRVFGTPADEPPPYYRVSQLSYDSLDELHAAITSAEGKAVLADLANFATGGTTVMLTDD